MATEFIYPVSTYDFPTIIKEGKVYIDKTEYVYNLTHKYNIVFLSRPRRFGKSMLCSTFQSYFEADKELFANLKLGKLEKDWIKYPVLRFDMSMLKHGTVVEKRHTLNYELDSYATKYGITFSENDAPRDRFVKLIEESIKQLNQKVVIIIDEYDAPLLADIGTMQLEETRKMMQGFYQVLKSCVDKIRFCFLTGITRFSQLSIFSEINHLKQISMLDEYSGICGITKDELLTDLRPQVEEFAEKHKITVEEAYQRLKNYYDGYKFSKHSEEIFNPYSVMNALCDKELGMYWFGSATPSSLLKQLERFTLADLADVEGAELFEDDFYAPYQEAETPIPLLYQSGYLSIKSYNPALESYILGVPNKEVRIGFSRGLMQRVVGGRYASKQSSVSLNVAKALLVDNINAALTAIQSYIANIPYDVISKDEWETKERSEKFYQLLLYLMFSSFNASVKVEVKSVRGRADIVMHGVNKIYVMELKVDDTVENALAQIDDKGYGIPYQADGKQLVKVGISFSSEKRNITEWKIKQ